MVLNASVLEVEVEAKVEAKVAVGSGKTNAGCSVIEGACDSGNLGRAT